MISATIPTRLEIARLRRDDHVLVDSVWGDRRRSPERDGRAAILARRLESLGVPDAATLADALLRCVGADLTVPSASARELGWAIEVALAGQSTFGPERDFESWEVKTSFMAADSSHALRLFSWPASRGETRALRSLETNWLGEPMVLCRRGAAGRARSRAQAPSARSVAGDVVWKRSLDSLRAGVERKLDNLLQVIIKRRRTGGQHDVLHISAIRALWGWDASRLDELLANRSAGLFVAQTRLSLGVRRSQLHLLYNNALNVVGSRNGPTRRLLVTGVGRRKPPSLLHPNPGRPRAKHVPALCASCGAPLPRFGACTVCPPNGFAV